MRNLSDCLINETQTSGTMQKSAGSSFPFKNMLLNLFGCLFFYLFPMQRFYYKVVRVYHCFTWVGGGVGEVAQIHFSFQWVTLSQSLRTPDIMDISTFPSCSQNTMVRPFLHSSLFHFHFLHQFQSPSGPVNGIPSPPPHTPHSIQSQQMILV